MLHENSILEVELQIVNRRDIDFHVPDIDIGGV